MTTQTAPHATQQQWQYESPMIGGLVVGFDGSPASHAALDSAGAIAAARRWPVHVVSVLAPMSSYKFELKADKPPSDVEELRRQLRDAAVRDAIGPDPIRAGWTRQILTGIAADQIARVAEKRGADLIILGRSQRGMVDRLLTGETTLNVMRCSSVPVMVVEDETAKPTTAVVAVDFGPASIRAARLALDMLDRRGTLYLVYVEEPIDLFPGAAIAPVPQHYPGEVVVFFRRMMEALRIPAGVVAETVMLNGSPVPAIEEFCERVGADLLAAGTHGLSRVASFFLGSVSTGLVRRTSIPIVIAPGTD
jgi:nucleotide-binding universal stress UspA family protein